MAATMLGKVLLALLAVTALLAGVGDAAPAAPTSPGHPLQIPLRSMQAPAGHTPKRDGMHAVLTAAAAAGAVPVMASTLRMMLVGNVSVGSPAQSLPVWFQTQDEEFYFLDVNGTGATTSRYDYTASSTAVVNNQPFWNGDQQQISGNNTVNETIQFNNFATNLTFGYATTYPDQTARRGIAGAIGLSPVPLQDTNITNFGTQFASSPSPIVSVSFAPTTYNVTSNAFTGTGQITMGAEDTDTCTGGYTYTPVDPLGVSYPTGFRVDTISGQATDGTAISLTVNANRTTVVYDSLPLTFGSTQLVQLLVNASGLVLQQGSYYEMPSCDAMQNASTLTMTLSGGATLSLSPYDYIYKNVTSDGTTTCGAQLWGYYDEADSAYTQYPLFLGQQYLNNHCYATNYGNGMIGIGAAKQTTMLTVVQ